MPQIPQYISKDKMNPEAGKTLNPQVGAAAGEALSDMGNVVAQLGEKMRKIGNANAESDAAIAISQFQLEDSTKRASLSTKDALNGIEDEVRKNTQATANQLFSDPFGKAEWLRKQEVQDAGYIIDRKADVYNRQVSERKVNTLRDLELEKSNYINAEPEYRQAVIAQMEVIANNPANEDIYTAEERKKLVDDTIKEGDDGIKDVNSLRRVKEKELKRASELAINSREKEFMQMKQNKQDTKGVLVTREDLVRMAKDESGKTISPGFAEWMINANMSPKAVGAKSKSVSFGNRMADINKGTRSESKIKQDILKDASDGYLSEEDEKNLTSYLDMLTSKQPDDLVTMNVRTSWNSTQVFSENTTGKEDSRRRMSLSFINKIQSGVEPKEAATEAMREEVIHLQPDVISKPEGMLYLDDTGRIKKIMPNGDILEEQSTKKDTRVKEKK
jgi:hypothetical protein